MDKLRASFFLQGSACFVVLTPFFDCHFRTIEDMPDVFELETFDNRKQKTVETAEKKNAAY
ncbi:hypothetical protein DPMN_187345 [Dreissena polymorpha]|uniref:Uncharacterized protein n=1 Tax=Dreissena polymorpha TaxID=45954 RepID=A0A9D4DRY0_DREPO|nr:hypothetical protein DPMN_187345 [Dreissena polymorpha]